MRLPPWMTPWATLRSPSLWDIRRRGEAGAFIPRFLEMQERGVRRTSGIVPRAFTEGDGAELRLPSRLRGGKGGRWAAAADEASGWLRVDVASVDEVAETAMGHVAACEAIRGGGGSGGLLPQMMPRSGRRGWRRLRGRRPQDGRAGQLPPWTRQPGQPFGRPSRTTCRGRLQETPPPLMRPCGQPWEAARGGGGASGGARPGSGHEMTSGVLPPWIRLNGQPVEDITVVVSRDGSRGS